MRWRLERTMPRRALLVGAALLTLETVLFTLCYAMAWRYLERISYVKSNHLKLSGAPSVPNSWF